MKKFTTDLPALYGDHHVIEVRRLLLDLPGIEDVYASSAFQVLQVSYDENKISEKDILSKLADAGYTGEMSISEESNLPATELGDKKVFRHTIAFQQTKQISFLQATSRGNRPLWPCPGIGTLKRVEE